MPAPGPYRRRRPPVACRECRRKKIRCDQALPDCGPCVKASLTCVYNHLRARGSSADLSIALQRATSQSTQSQQQEWALPPVTQEDYLDFRGAFGDFDMSLAQQPDFTMNAINVTPPPQDTASTSVSALSSSESTDPQTSNGSTLFKQQFSEKTTPAAIARQTSYIKFERLAFLETKDTDSIVDRDLQSMLKRYRHLEANLHDAVAKVRTCDSYLFPRSSEPVELLPPRSDCEKLVHSYLDTYESVTRILHVPHFLSSFDSVWAHPEATNECFLYQLLLFIAIGASFPAQSDVSGDQKKSRWRSQALSWIAAAQGWLTQQISVDPRTDLNTLQTCCLLLLARKSNQAPGNDPFWLADDILVRKAMGLGLHREPSVLYPSIKPYEAEMRRRLWCTILEISIQGSLTSGLPPVISREAYDCRPPSNLDDSVIEAEVQSSSIEPGTFTQSTISCLLAKSHGIRLQILTIFNAPSGEPIYEKALELAAELVVMCEANLRTLKSLQATAATRPKAVQPTNFQIKLLDLCTRRFVALLHSPFAERARLSPSYYYSRKMRMETCAHLLQYPLTEICNSSTDSDGTKSQDSNDTTFSHDSGIFDTWFSGCLMRYSALALCQDLIVEIAENAFPIINRDHHTHLLQLVRQSVVALRSRVTTATSKRAVSPSPCGYNTRHVPDTLASCHEFLVLQCAVTQIDAMRQHGSAAASSEESIDKAIFHAAKSGLDVCCEVLSLTLQEIQMIEAQDWVFDSHMPVTLPLPTQSSDLSSDNVDNWQSTMMGSCT
ncbi:hypothetical protein ACLMJK_009438 [Lecanora helva]